MSEEKIRVLLAKTGFCIHDVGVKIVAMSLRSAGMEVIYMGLAQTPDKIATAALQEDVDVVGISIVADPAVPVMREVLDAMKRKNSADIPLVCGGRIIRQDVPLLQKMGIRGIFKTATPMASIVDGIRQIVAEDRRSKGVAKVS